MPAGFGGEGVEVGEELLAGLEDHGREFLGRHIEDVGGEDGAAELRQSGDVDGEVVPWAWTSRDT